MEGVEHALAQIAQLVGGDAPRTNHSQMEWRVTHGTNGKCDTWAREGHELGHEWGTSWGKSGERVGNEWGKRGESVGKAWVQ